MIDEPLFREATACGQLREATAQVKGKIHYDPISIV